MITAQEGKMRKAPLLRVASQQININSIHNCPVSTQDTRRSSPAQPTKTTGKMLLSQHTKLNPKLYFKAVMFLFILLLLLPVKHQLESFDFHDVNCYPHSQQEEFPRSSKWTLPLENIDNATSELLTKQDLNQILYAVRFSQQSWEICTDAEKKQKQKSTCMECHHISAQPLEWTVREERPSFPAYKIMLVIASEQILHYFFWLHTSVLPFHTHWSFWHSSNTSVCHTLTPATGADCFSN